jgi:hypothetical protein
VFASDPNVDPTEDPGVEIIEEEGSDQALGVTFPSINNTEVLQLVDNISLQQTSEAEMLENQSESIMPGRGLGNKSIAITTNQTEEGEFGTSGNFTVEQLPQQPLVDEFGNIIPTENVTAIDGFAVDNLTAEQEQAPLVDEFGNIIPTENVTAVDNFTAGQLQPLQPQQPLVDEFGNIVPSENVTIIDNFTAGQLQPLQPQQPLVDELGNIIPTQPSIDNFTQPLQSPGDTMPSEMTAEVEICDNLVDDDSDGLVDFYDPEGCSPA